MNFFAKDTQIDCSHPVNLGNGVWWVGYQDESSGLRCNPYIIIDGEEAIVIDGGSRPDFPVVMMKILETGLNPRKIIALIYDHYDPDLCGSVANFEEMIDRPDLKIISSAFSQIFIRHYGTRSKMVKISELSYRFTFSSGRILEFIPTPYCHSHSSFSILDHKSKILFSGDIFGTYDKIWQLFFSFPDDCKGNSTCDLCAQKQRECYFQKYYVFHRRLMPCSKALHSALARLKELSFLLVAPQHGSILNQKSAKVLIEKLSQLNDIGIDNPNLEE